MQNDRQEDSDSNESSKYSLPILIPRLDSSDDKSDKESDWMSTTEELRDDETVISHESKVLNENRIKIEDMRVIRSENLVPTRQFDGTNGAQE